MAVTDNYNFNLSNEAKLLLLCARKPMEKEVRDEIIYLVQQDIDWKYLHKIASKHSLKPLLYWQLKHICSDKIPLKFMQNLKEFLKDNANKNLFFMKELINILKILSDHDIESVPYKGPVLAQQLYNNLTMRQFGDLDLLIRKDDFLIIKELLISKGYMPRFNLNHIQEQNYINSQRELTFINKSNGISLELHWKLSSIFLNLPINAEKVFLQNLNIINFGGAHIPAISPENLILVLSIHNASHQWSRLAWLVDIATLIYNNEINWSQVFKLSEQFSIQKILFINLYLCQFLLDSKFDVNLSKHFCNNKVIEVSNVFAKNYFSDISEKGLIKNMEISFNLRENKIDGIKDVLSSIFKPSFYELNNLKLPSYLFFLYYIYRPFNLLKRYKLFK